MIQQGTDGLSRGEENRLATGGLSLGGMVPLHLSATERRTMMGGWIQGWWDSWRKLLMMEPRDWFTTAHTPGYFGWLPAPATADTAIDHLPLDSCFWKRTGPQPQQFTLRKHWQKG
jgi:hypothetical protein